MLEVRRSELSDYLKRVGLCPRLDASNLEPVHLRNRIRQDLLPHLAENYNPHIGAILCGMAKVLQADEEYLAGQAEERFSRVAKKKGQQIIVDLDRLKKLPLSLQRRILRKGIESVKGNLRGISLTQLDRILEIIKGPSGLEIHLPRDVVARHSYGDLIISGKGREERRGPGRRPAFKEAHLEVPGETEIKEFKLRVRCSLLPRRNVRLPGKGSLPEKDRAYFDFDKIKLPLRIRRRKRGDGFRPLGMKGRKKLKDFFIDRKVPREERGEVPLLVQGENILWVIGHRQGEEAKVTSGTKKVLRVEITVES